MQCMEAIRAQENTLAGLEQGMAALEDECENADAAKTAKEKGIGQLSASVAKTQERLAELEAAATLTNNIIACGAGNQGTVGAGDVGIMAGGGGAAHDGGVDNNIGRNTGENVSERAGITGHDCTDVGDSKKSADTKCRRMRRRIYGCYYTDEAGWGAVGTFQKSDELSFMLVVGAEFAVVYGGLYCYLF